MMLEESLLRAARGAELAALLALEDEAGRLYGDLGMDPDMPGLELGELEEGLASDSLWVLEARSGGLVGFALAWARPGALHLRELDVRPRYARLGLGSRLLGHVEAQASSRGLPSVTLTTFLHVPFNAPFYARRGYRPLAPSDCPPWLHEIRLHEAELGLDRWPRIAMEKVVG